MKFRVLTYCLVGACSLWGQDSLTLQRCLELAEGNKNAFAQQSSSLDLSVTERKFHPWTLLPNLSAYSSFNTSFGRRLDPFTNTFASTNVNSQSFGLNTSLNLFNGFSYYHKRAILNRTIQKNEIILEQSLNNRKLKVIETYLELCKLTEQLQLAETRIEKYTGLQAIQRALIREGRISVVDTLKSHNSMLAEQALTEKLKSEYRVQQLELNYLTGQAITSNSKVRTTSISEVSQKTYLSEYYELGKLDADQQINASQLLTDRAGILPTFSLSGLLVTGFSTNNKDYTQAGNPTKRYSDQLNQNIYEGIGFSLNIPLFNRGVWLKTRQLSAIKQAEISSQKEQVGILLEKAKLELEQKQLQVKGQIDYLKQVTANLKLIYETSVNLYREGRINYSDLELSFLEWQNKELELTTLELEYQTIKLYQT